MQALGTRTVGVGGEVSPWTTPPSVASNILRVPASNPLRAAGVAGFYLQMLYAYYMLGVEDHCLSACAGDTCAY